ncbi:piggyBac transposable element-derived protein 4-like [Trichonephila clavipes]|nr:piggyBac transposable element-derived protein 4-like [Trichonephila clavipes]
MKLTLELLLEMMEWVGKASHLKIVRVEELLKIIFSKKKVAQPVMQSEVLKIDDLDAFISILYDRGIKGGNNLKLNSLWSVAWSPPFFRDTTASDRFRDLMKFLRFDKKTTQSECLQADKLRFVFEVWNKFVENSIIFSKPTPYLTIDEQLFPYKTRCHFTQYMPSLPDKFGMKFWFAADINSKYKLNGFTYLCKYEERPVNIFLSEYVVLRLIKPSENKARNTTTDNFFITLNLSQMLQTKNLSWTGTMKWKEVPEFVKKVKMPLYNTLLLEPDDITSTIYQGKARKIVLLVSSIHATVDISNNYPKKLPETISFYNSKKFGINDADKMTRKYSAKRQDQGSSHTVHVFYHIFDLAVINSWILYKEVSEPYSFGTAPALSLVQSFSTKAVHYYDVLDTNDDLNDMLEERTLPQIRTFQVPLKGGYNNLVELHFKYDQARRRYVEWAQNKIAVVPDFHKRILFSDEVHFWLNGYVNKQNCRIWNEANPQLYVEKPLHPEKLTVWCALWAGGILLQKR